MGSLKIGTCGYGYYNPPGDWEEKYESKLQAYSDVFDLVEINKTFYTLPMTDTMERWRQEVLPPFEFTVKAWQALTHPTSSPTWRDNKKNLSEEQKEYFGYLRPHKVVIDAWEAMKERASALKSKICVIQMSGSFGPTDEHERDMRELLSTIDRGKLELAWEPRGEWKDQSDRVKEICDDLNLIHVVDVMRRDPVSDHPIAYVRLHGLNPQEYNYNYDYSRKELANLAKKLQNLRETHTCVYCMFNNYEMFDNALTLIELL